jgi:amidohydrolase
VKTSNNDCPTSAVSAEDIAALKREVCEQIDALADVLIDVSQQIHKEPELAFEEYKASNLLSQVATEHGLDVKREAFGLSTAFVADIGVNPGPKIAILSEYDALPNIGHACGHNMIAAMGLGAALALNTQSTKLPGRVRYLGTPAEERGAGKEVMARNGAFENIDAAMMIHPAGVNVKDPRSICVAEVRVTMHGRQAHASAYPEDGINALDALVLAYQGIAALRQHIGSGDRVHGIFTEAGTAPNVVPDKTSALFYVRSTSIEGLAPLKKRVEACLRSGAIAAGCEAGIVWGDADYHNMVTNVPLADAYEQNAKALGLTDFLPGDQFPLAATDMGNVSHRVPCLHPLIAFAPPEVSIHDPDFATWAGSKRGDETVITGAKALAMTAIDFLLNTTLQQQTLTAYKQATSEPVKTDSSETAHAPACPCC